jgi:hypothetical protein
MPTSAPRLDARLRERLDRLARSGLSYAEIRRGLVVRARELDIPPPSYEHVRRLARQRRLERELQTGIRTIALEVAVGARPPTDLLLALQSGYDPRERTSL